MGEFCHSVWKNNDTRSFSPHLKERIAVWQWSSTVSRVSSAFTSRRQSFWAPSQLLSPRERNLLSYEVSQGSFLCDCTQTCRLLNFSVMMQDSLQSPVITSGLCLPAHSPPGVLLGLLWLGAPMPGRMLRWRQQAPQDGITTKKNPWAWLFRYPETWRVPSWCWQLLSPRSSASLSFLLLLSVWCHWSF